MPNIFSLELRRRQRLWLIAGSLFLLMLLVSIWLTGPAPPRRIIMATGKADGGYAMFGLKYQEKLNKMGLKVDLVNSTGSLENFELLIAGKADVAFVQSGTYQLADDPKGVVRGLAAVYLEPLWFFYRGNEAAKGLADFKKKTIAIGIHHSGIEAVGRRLLKENGIDESNATIIDSLDMSGESQRLKEGKIDVALFVTSSNNPLILDLLQTQGIRLLDFHRQVAYCRRFPYLTPAKLAEGVVNLEHNIPKEDILLLAPAAMLVCREDLHPRAIEQILNTAQSIHASGSLVDSEQKFPSLNQVDVPIHDAAERYMRSGESILARLLPYRGVLLLYRAQILILPFLVVWIPFLKVLPAIYSWRINRLLRHHYIALREVENTIQETHDPDKLRAQLQVLDNLRHEIAWISRKIPGHLQRDVYIWRSHVLMVSNEALDRLKRLEDKKSTLRGEGEG